MYLYNSPEYAGTNFAAMKISGVPINVNYRYLTTNSTTFWKTPISRRWSFTAPSATGAFVIDYRCSKP